MNRRVSLQVVLNDMPEFNFCQMEEILNLSSWGGGISEFWFIDNFLEKAWHPGKEEAAVSLARNLEAFSTSTLIALSTIGTGFESLIGRCLTQELNITILIRKRCAIWAQF